MNSQTLTISLNMEMVNYILYAIALILLFFLILKKLNKTTENFADQPKKEPTIFITRKRDEWKNPAYNEPPIILPLDFEQVTKKPASKSPCAQNVDRIEETYFNAHQVEPQQTYASKNEKFEMNKVEKETLTSDQLNKNARALMNEQLNKPFLKEALPKDNFEQMDKYILDRKKATPKNVTGYDVQRVYRKNEEVLLPSLKDKDGKIVKSKKHICNMEDGDGSLGCIACKVDYSTPENLVNQNETNTNIMEVCKYGNKNGELPSREQCLFTCSAKPDKFN